MSAPKQPTTSSKFVYVVLAALPVVLMVKLHFVFNGVMYSNQRHASHQHDLAVHLSVESVTKQYLSYHWQRYKEMHTLTETLEHGERGAAYIDYKFLKFDMGMKGELLLDRLLALKDHPEYTVIREQISRLVGVDSWAEWHAIYPVEQGVN